MLSMLDSVDEMVRWDSVDGIDNDGDGVVVVGGEIFYIFEARMGSSTPNLLQC